jgi:hypothetical protein
MGRCKPLANMLAASVLRHLYMLLATTCIAACRRTYVQQKPEPILYLAFFSWTAHLNARVPSPPPATFRAIVCNLKEIRIALSSHPLSSTSSRLGGDAYNILR